MTSSKLTNKLMMNSCFMVRTRRRRKKRKRTKKLRSIKKKIDLSIKSIMILRTSKIDIFIPSITSL